MECTAPTGADDDENPCSYRSGRGGAFELAGGKMTIGCLLIRMRASESHTEKIPEYSTLVLSLAEGIPVQSCPEAARREGRSRLYGGA